MSGLWSAILRSPSDREASAAAHEALDVLGSLRGLGDRSLVARAEAEVAADPAGTFRVDADGVATLACRTGEWRAGRFDTPSIAELRDAVAADPEAGSGSVRLFVLEGGGPLTDIGWLQAAAPERALFQVASQFNCLESPGLYLVPVADYFSDSTQGPRAAIGAFPAALLRHYRAPDGRGGTFAQSTDGRQIDLLEGALAETGVRSGYLTGGDIPSPERYADELEASRERIRVGIHTEAEVALGPSWDGGLPEPPPRPIAQCLTSTVAGGLYGGGRALGAATFGRIAGELLRAAYLGTLLGALATRREWAFLTLIGGGVFKNPLPLIWESILHAFDEIEATATHDLTVVVNGRDIGAVLALESDILPEVRARGGRVIRFGGRGLIERLA